uniref:SAP domain-containing protein n=1 Tax=Skeletonema marinoi TaxID=267567 RepID=A0A6U3Y072_9STRA|mmetsp:Transcript_3385/g.5689  ORF Transcript_3385/g.5689 Transcript_3385/m.5689 type:complete len:713 (+) Transcript_3385:130-2268(+)
MSNPFGEEEPDWFLDPDDDGGDANDDDENNPSSAGGFGAEHILLLIDCHESMFEKYIPLLDDADMDDDDDNEEMEGSNNNAPAKEKKLFAPHEVAITAAHRLLRMKIRNIAETKTGKRDGVGILLYGCNTKRGLQGKLDTSPKSGGDDESDSDEEEEQHSTHELLELAPPGTEHILKVQECVPPSRDNKSNQQQRDLQKEFSTLGSVQNDDDDEGVSDGCCTLRQALVDANKIFEAAKCVKMRSPSGKDLPDAKTIWIFTNQDNPCSSEFDKIQTITHAKDLKDATVDIHVMPLPKKSGDFDKTFLYNDLLSPISVQEDVDCFADNSGTLDIEDVLEHFGHFARKVRKYAYVPLFLPGWKEREGDPGIMLDLYSVVRERKKPVPITVHQEKSTATAKRSSIIDKENGGVVEKKDLHYFAEFCGGRVTLHPDDIAKLKDLSRSNMAGCVVLLGFKPMASLDVTFPLSKNSIAFANDSIVAGSNKAFYNLKDAMERKNVYAVAELHTRAKSVSRMVALVPHRSSNGGLLIMPLPFKEDVREVAKEDIGFADQEAVDAAKNLISKSTVNHEGNFSEMLPENPWLKHFFGYLESISLGRELDEVEDETKMDVEGLLAVARQQIEDFSISLPIDPEPVKKERKRKADAVSKTSKGDTPMEDIDEEWIDLYKNDEISGKTAPELKAFLKSRGERVGGKKGELVDRVNRVIYDHIFSKK